MGFDMFILEGCMCQSFQPANSAMEVRVLGPDPDMLARLASLIESGHVVTGDYATDVLQEKVTGNSRHKSVNVPLTPTIHLCTNLRFGRSHRRSLARYDDTQCKLSSTPSH